MKKRILALVFAGLFIVGCEGGSSAGNPPVDTETLQTIAINKVKAYADDNTLPIPTVQDYINTGVQGITEENLDNINDIVADLSAEEVDTQEEIKALVDELGIVIPPDNTAPVITLNGELSMILIIGNIYSEPGATAVDTVDGSVSIVITGSVDTDTKGTYSMTYTAEDSAGNSASKTRTVTVVDSNTQSKYTFVMIHFEAGYQGRLNNDLPINIPQEYMTIHLGWQAYLFDTAKKLVQKANDYGFRLTLAFNPQWAEYVLLDNTKVNLVKQWQENGHEVAFHHHSVNHPDWNGYSNDPNAINNSIPFLGDVDTGINNSEASLLAER